MKIDWVEAAHFYLVNRTASYKTVADKFQVSLQSVKAHGTKEHWRTLRQQAVREVLQKLPETSAQELVHFLYTSHIQ